MQGRGINYADHKSEHNHILLPKRDTFSRQANSPGISSATTTCCVQPLVFDVPARGGTLRMRAIESES